MSFLTLESLGGVNGDSSLFKVDLLSVDKLVPSRKLEGVRLRLRY